MPWPLSSKARVEDRDLSNKLINEIDMTPTKSIITKASKLAELISDKTVWKYFCENHDNELDYLCGKIVEVDEGRPLMGHLDIGLMATASEECGELSFLATECFSRLSPLDRKTIVNEVIGLPVLDNYGSKENRDMMIKMLGLREWSTKEDILRALAEIL